ncbi:unnamed protein product, partial [Phytomonas sp. Hart1]
MNPAEGVRRPLSAKFRLGVSIGPAISSSPPEVNPPPPPPVKGMSVKPLEHITALKKMTILPPNNAQSASPPIHTINNNNNINVDSVGEKERRYGGAIVRVSELRRRGGLLPEASLLGGGLSSSSSLPSTSAPSFHEPFYLARVDETKEKEGIEMRKRRERGDEADPGRKSRRVGSSAARKKPSARRRGSSTGKRSKSSFSSLSLRADGRPFEYRWFTAHGKRQLVYDGKPYTGKKAHQMWTELKRIELKVANSRMQCPPSGIPTSRATKPQPPKPRSPSRALSKGISSPHAPLRAEWANLYQDIDLGDDFDVADSHFLSLNNSSAPTKPALPAGRLAIKEPIRGPRPVGPPKPLSGTSPASAFPTPNGMVGMIEDEEAPRGENPLTSPKPPPLPHKEATSSKMEWPISYFGSDSESSYSSSDEEGEEDDDEESLTDDEKVILVSPKVQTDEEVHPSNRRRDLNSTRQKRREVGARFSPSLTSRVDYKGVEIVEHDGWLYTAELLNSIQNEGKFALDNSSQKKKSNMNYPSSTEGGLVVIGMPNPQCKPPLEMPLLRDNDAFAPILNRFEEDGSVFESLNKNEMVDLFEAGDEIGGVRYSM